MPAPARLCAEAAQRSCGTCYEATQGSHMTSLNRCVVMAARPQPGEVPASTWRLEERALPELADGEALVRVAYIDVQPAMRGWLNPTPAYTQPIHEGDVMRAQGVG